MKRTSRALSLLIAGAAAAALAVPTSAAQPSTPPGQEKKAEKAPETPVTITGTVAKTTDGKGRPAYSITAGGKTWTLSAGPVWFWGDKNPLEASVGKSVSVAGTTRGNDELDVETVDGQALLKEGKPAWAGGPSVVGEAHPGWKHSMSDARHGNGNGRVNAPGQQKKADATP